MIPKDYYSNGKLLLTGEYLVMNGASALVLPLNVGQLIGVSVIPEDTGHKIYWNSFQDKTLWFHAQFDLKNFSIVTCSDKNSAEYILRLLKVIDSIRPEFFNFNYSLRIESFINFNPDWGLGSSSTLIANLAKWAEINPFELHRIFTSGSGFDIAAANSNSPIIYKVINGKPSIRPVDFLPCFSEKLYFVYLGNKQNSENEVKKYLVRNKPNAKIVDSISDITERITCTTSIEEFEYLLSAHEKLMAAFLKKQSVKEARFPDYKGEVKSMGAWGGDFVIMTCKLGKEYLTEYLYKKQLETYFQFSDLVLHPATTSKTLIS